MIINTNNVRARGNRIAVIESNLGPNESEGGIVLPETVRNNQPAAICDVFHISPDAEDVADLHVGSTVVVSLTAGVKLMSADGDRLIRLVYPSEIAAILS